MKYSDWQLNRLRDALRAYKQYRYTSDGKPQSWAYVRDTIAAETGYEIGTSAKNGAERLRQFVEGLYITERKKKEKPHKRAIPNDEALDAIVQFALSPENALLSEEELNEYVPEYQAPIRLLEYLDEHTDAERRIPVEQLKGIYQARVDESANRAFSVREITLQQPSDQGLVQVIETEDNYHQRFLSSYDSASREKRKRNRKSHVKRGGWAVVTPEDNLLFFMKDAENGRNRYYFTLAADIVSWNADPAKQFFLLDHDFPLQNEEEYAQGKELSSIVQEKTPSKILTFLRYEAAQKQEQGNERAKQRG